jgi:hypothetical protein
MSSSSSTPLLEKLKSTSWPMDFVSCLDEIMKSSTTTATPYRCEETIAAIVEKRSFIQENKFNTDLIFKMGEFFMFFLPKDDDGELTKAKKLCRIPPISFNNKNNNKKKKTPQKLRSAAASTRYHYSHHTK